MTDVIQTDAPIPDASMPESDPVPAPVANTNELFAIMPVAQQSAESFATPSPTLQPAPPVAPDMAALVQMLAAALQQSGAGTADAIREGLSSQAAMSRAPIPETYLSGGYPDQGVFNHPQGGEHNTRLRCPMFLGVFTEKGEVIPAFEVIEKNCTERERVLFNQLTPGVFPVERNDGIRANWRVVQQTDDLDQPIRLVVAVPAPWLSKAEQAQMPGQIRFLTQLTSGLAA